MNAMKKHIFSAMLLVGMATMASAQFYAIENNEVKMSLDYTPDYITFENPMACGGVIGEAVDLGLSVKWSSVNIGANKPENYGNYYAWGESETKAEYTWSNYKYMAEGYSNWNGINKYQVEDGRRACRWYDYTNGRKFIGDNKTELDKEDDAAAVNWGGDWRMPTAEQMNELSAYCTWKWISSEERRGYEITGTNGNSIFLSVTGNRYSWISNGEKGALGNYWTSTLDKDLSSRAYDLYFFKDSYATENVRERFYSHAVRAVITKQGDVNGHETIDLGLPSETLWATCNVGATSSDEAGSLFAWGETETKDIYQYSWSTYKYVCEGGTNWQDITKYTIDDAHKTDVIWYDYATGEYDVDNKTELESSDDAATKLWGDEWRMPTNEEWAEICDQNNCAWAWTENYKCSGVSGYIVISKKAGYEGNSIFLPAAGYYYDNIYYFAGVEGQYWSSTLYRYDSKSAWQMYMYSDMYSARYIKGRHCGYSIRPVTSK